MKVTLEDLVELEISESYITLFEDKLLYEMEFPEVVDASTNEPIVRNIICKNIVEYEFAKEYIMLSKNAIGIDHITLSYNQASTEDSYLYFDKEGNIIF